MALGSLLTLLDDIATTLDDVAVMTKVTAKKTAGLLGDDLALNAEQVTGIAAARELPVVWAVAKGSFLNKLILVPIALLISYFAPWLINPLLMIGGAFLCFEGFEKVFHKFWPAEHGHKQNNIEAALNNPETDWQAIEAEKIKGAIRTDFILSAEIIVVALGTVADADFNQQILVVSVIAGLMTVGVYGLVAGIVKLDDLGLYLLKQKQGSLARLKQKLGEMLLSFAPILMHLLTFFGTLAMFLVGGGIFTHALSALHHWQASITSTLTETASWLSLIAPIILDGLIGLVIGFICYLLIQLIQTLRPKHA